MGQVLDNVKSKRYSSLNGLRAYSAIGVAMMHVLKNGGYEIGYSAIDAFISSLGDLVYLFMVMSAFSMCCGYYDSFSKGSLNLEQFYVRRFKKVWGFFALICCIDVVLAPSREAIYELIANLTLCFGLLPNSNMSVVGVGWFLGLICVFYLLFPFFIFLLQKKQRAWGAFVVSVLLNVLCSAYFMDKNHVVIGYDLRANIIYTAMFFVTGGIIYLYREIIEKYVKRYLVFIVAICVVIAGVYFYVSKNSFVMLALASGLLICAIGSQGKILSNRFTKLIGGISFEIYLCHMMFYRIVEKIHLAKLFGNGMASYLFTVLLTLIGAIVFSLFFGKVITVINKKTLQHRRMQHNV